MVYMRLLPTLLSVLALAVLASGCDQAEQSEEPDTPVDEATVDMIVEDPDAYDGSEVIIVEATVVPIEPKDGFVLEGDQARILVYAPSGTPDLEGGEQVPVRGEVVRFTEPAAEALPEEFADAEALANAPTDVGDPYVLLRAAPATPEGEVSDGAMRDLGDERATLAGIVRNPEEREGDQVAVAGRVVRSEERAFVLAARGERLLIVPQSDPEKTFPVGSIVRAEGKVEPIPVDDPEGIGEDQIFDEFEGQPTIAATSLTVLQG